MSTLLLISSERVSPLCGNIRHVIRPSRYLDMLSLTANWQTVTVTAFQQVGPLWFYFCIQYESNVATLNFLQYFHSGLVHFHEILSVSYHFRSTHIYRLWSIYFKFNKMMSIFSTCTHRVLTFSVSSFIKSNRRDFIANNDSAVIGKFSLLHMPDHIYNWIEAFFRNHSHCTRSCLLYTSDAADE